MYLHCIPYYLLVYGMKTIVLKYPGIAMEEAIEVKLFCQTEIISYRCKT